MSYRLVTKTSMFNLCCHCNCILIGLPTSISPLPWPLPQNWYCLKHYILLNANQIISLSASKPSNGSLSRELWSPYTGSKEDRTLTVTFICRTSYKVGCRHLTGHDWTRFTRREYFINACSVNGNSVTREEDKISHSDTTSLYSSAKFSLFIPLYTSSALLCTPLLLA